MCNARLSLLTVRACQCVRAMSRSVSEGGAEPEIVTQVPGSEGAGRNGSALGPLMYIRRGGGKDRL